jgi:hypothetical protein
VSRSGSRVRRAFILIDQLRRADTRRSAKLGVAGEQHVRTGSPGSVTFDTSPPLKLTVNRTTGQILVRSSLIGSVQVC